MSEACPSQSGTIHGYKVEYKEGDVWRTLETTEVNSPLGAAYPTLHGPILKQIGLMGHAQAKAIAWKAKADSVCESLVFRLVKYKIEYSIKAFRQDAVDESSLPREREG